MSKKLKADILLLTITVVWGSSFPLMKMVLSYLPAFAYISIRFLFAALILMAIFHRNLIRIRARTLLYGSILGLLMFAGMALQVNGLFTTTASNSGFITGLNVVIVPLISAYILKKRPDRASVAGVAIAFAGLFFLSGGLSFNFNTGDQLTFFCSICWAFQIIFVDRFTEKEDAALLAILQVGFTGLAGTGFWLAVDFKPLVINTTVVIIILITAVFGTALAFGGQTIAQKDTSPTHTALIFTAEPVFAALFAMIIPNAEGKTEVLGLSSAVGCVLILAGMLVSELKIGGRRNSWTDPKKVQEGLK